MPVPDEFEVFNDTTEDAPAGGLAFWSGGFTDQGALKLVKPTADSQPHLVVLGEFSVPSKVNGIGSFSPRCLVAFDPESGEPGQGDTVGSVSGSWYAKKGNKGFTVYGGAVANWAACMRSDDQATGGEPPPDDCTGCDWFAGMDATHCLQVSVNGTATDLHLFTTDGDTWASDDILSICGQDFTVSVARNAGGVPQLTLTGTGSGGSTFAGQWSCCGCAFAKWGFNLQSLCPDEDDTGNPCTNVIEVRVDAAVCAPPPGDNCCTAPTVQFGQVMRLHRPTGGAGTFGIWKINVIGGTTYHCFVGNGGDFGTSSSASATLYDTDDCCGSLVEEEFPGLGAVETTDPPTCVEFTPSQDGCLCLGLSTGGHALPVTLEIREGPCP